MKPNRLFRSCLILAAFFAFIRTGYSSAQTVNTLPAENIINTTLHTFLGKEIANYLHLRFPDEIISGGIGAVSKDLSHSISAVVGFPNGFYTNHNIISHTYIASKRTFVYLRDEISREITIPGAIISYNAHYVFATMLPSSSRPDDPDGTLALMQVDSNEKRLTAVSDLRLVSLHAQLSAHIYDLAYPSLAEADSAAVAQGKTLVISTQWNTVPNTISSNVRMITGGKLNNPAAVTFKGIFEADVSCHFVGRGAVHILKAEAIYPQWFGAKGDYNSDTYIGTNDADAIQAACNAGKRDSIIKFPPGRYFVASPISIQKADSCITLSGYGAYLFGSHDMADNYIFNIYGDHSTVGNSIHNTIGGFTSVLHGAKGFINLSGVSNSVLKDIIIWEAYPTASSPVKNTVGINLNDCYNVSLDTIKISPLSPSSGIGVQIISTSAEYPTNVAIDNSLIQGSWKNIAINSYKGMAAIKISNNGLGGSSSTRPYIGMYGIYVTGAVRALEIIGNFFEYNNKGISLNGPSISASITSNFFNRVDNAYEFIATGGKATLQNNSYESVADINLNVFAHNDYDVIQLDSEYTSSYITSRISGSGMFTPYHKLPDVPPAFTQSQAINTVLSSGNGIRIYPNQQIQNSFNDFTLVWRGSLPDYSKDCVLFDKGSKSSKVSLMRFIYSASGTTLSLHLDSSTSNTPIIVASVNVGILIPDVPITLAVSVYRESSRTNGSVAIYKNGIKLSTTTIPAAPPPSIDFPGHSLKICGANDGTLTYAASTSFVAIYNRALSTDEHKALDSHGIAFKHRRASQTALTDGTLNIGQEYTIDTYVSGDDFTNLGGNNATGSVFVASATTPHIWTHNSSLRAVGATVQLEPDNLQPPPAMWLDSSPNKLHAKLPATDARLSIHKNSFEIRGSISWSAYGGPKVLSYFDENILPNNSFLNSIIITVTGTDIQDIVIGDGNAPDYFTQLTSGLSAGTYDLTIAHKLAIGDYRKFIVSPDATATMTINFVIMGIIL